MINDSKKISNEIKERTDLARKLKKETESVAVESDTSNATNIDLNLQMEEFKVPLVMDYAQIKVIFYLYKRRNKMS